MCGQPMLAGNTSSATAPAVDASQAKYANGIAAVVNDKIITLDQVRKQVDPLVQRIYSDADYKFSGDPDAAHQYIHDQLARLFSDILHSMVDKILIIQAFKDAGYSIPKPFLDQQYDESITTRFNGDREMFLNYLKSSSMTEREYRDQISDDIIVGYMRNKLRDSQTGIGPDRIVKYYNDHKQQWYQEQAVQLRQITLQPTNGETQDVLMQEAQDIVQQARKQGADFAELARKKSQDEYRDKGGEVDWIEKGKYQPAIETVVFALKPGQVSDPVPLNGDVYIFLCEDKREAGVQPMDKVHVQIEYALVTEDAHLAEQKWLDKLRKNAYIKYNM
jgi:peptidyl-prolyl cis-trans isomerase SurA